MKMPNRCSFPGLVLLVSGLAWVAAPTGNAAVIPLVNGDFEIPGAFAPMWSSVLGWDAAGVNDFGSGTVQFPFDASNGFSGGLSPLDDGVLQTTAHGIDPTDLFTVLFDVASLSGIGELAVTLYAYDTNLPIGTRTPLVVESVFVNVPNVWQPYSFSYAFNQPLLGGLNLGIEFNNVLEPTTVYIDNVQLSVVPVPEPGAIAMIAIAFGSLLMLRRRERGRRGIRA